ncbi:MAG TPA: hypothetical protein VH744_06280, partial [Terriglobales bacterium]
AVSGQPVWGQGSAPSGRRTAPPHDLTTQHLLDALAQTVPLSTTRSEEIQALRAWASTRAVPASARDARGEGA